MGHQLTRYHIYEGGHVSISPLTSSVADSSIDNETGDEIHKGKGYANERDAQYRFWLSPGTNVA